MKTVLTEEEQKKYLLSKIGREVRFRYPEPPEIRIGQIIDRIVAKDTDDDNVTYWNLVDLIKFENDKEDWLRITYYRYKKKAIPPKKRIGWVFAGQTSLSDPISSFRDLFVRAIEEKPWIRPLFKQVFKQCAKYLE